MFRRIRIRAESVNFCPHNILSLNGLTSHPTGCGNRQVLITPEPFKCPSRFERMSAKTNGGTYGTWLVCEPGLRHGIPDGFLYQLFVGVMTSLFLGLAVDPPVFLWKDPLPAPVLRRVGILSIKGIWKLDTAPPIGQIFLVNRFHLVDLEPELTA
jgi:hypothetical protein